MTLQYTRDESGLELLSSGTRDLAFIGEDKLREFTLTGLLKDVNIVDEIPINCSFVLAGMKNSNTMARIKNGEPLLVATSYPFVFASSINEAFVDLRPAYVSGATEGYVSSGLMPLVFDITSSGKSLEENDLEIYAKSSKLNLYVVDRCMFDSRNTGERMMQGIMRVADTLFKKVGQIDSGEYSYTLDLMRSQNKRVKKLGEEFGELMQAFLREDKSREEIISEAADLLYAIEIFLALEGLSILQVIAEDIRRNNINDRMEKDEN